jgi:hypothetical protein
MSVPTPMILRDAGVPIGEILDYGRGKILATAFIGSGRVPLGFHPTRRDAMEAIAARHAGGRPEPPRAA